MLSEVNLFHRRNDNLGRRNYSSNNKDRKWQNLSFLLECTSYQPSPSWLALVNYPCPISFFLCFSLWTWKSWHYRWLSPSEGFALQPAACKLKALKQSLASPSQQIFTQEGNTEQENNSHLQETSHKSKNFTMGCVMSHQSWPRPHLLFLKLDASHPAKINLEGQLLNWWDE